MSNKYFSFLKALRVERGFSQAEIALKLHISRSSYIAFEQGKRELTLKEANQLSELFEISLSDIQNGKIDTPEVAFEKKSHVAKSAKRDLNDPTPEERIFVPQEKVDKFKQVLLYILAKVGGKPNVGQTVLYKILYFIDFDYYEKFEEQLIGARYMKNTHGPTPVMFPKIIKQLVAEGAIEAIKSKFYKYDQTKYLINPNIAIDLSTLTARELAHIDEELDRLSDMTAKKISDLSHIDTPWKIAKEKGILEYEFVFYRPDETSVREYEPL